MIKVANIGILGSHKVGKTTLYREIVKELRPEWKINCLDELAKERISEVNTFFNYMTMQEGILTEQIKVLDWMKENEVSTFSDRTLIDNLSYMIIGRESPYPYALSGDYKSNLEIIKMLSSIVSEAIAHFCHYDLLFYIPIEFNYGSPTKEEILYQWRVDNIIKQLLKVYGIKYYTIKGSVEERKILVLERIKQYMEGE